jgi:hypothetical protein
MAPSIWQVLIVLAIVVAIFASRYRTWLGRQLHRESDETPTVSSAETARAKEGEYKRPQSPTRIVSWAISGIIVALVIAASWWAATQ